MKIAVRKSLPPRLLHRHHLLDCHLRCQHGLKLILRLDTFDDRDNEIDLPFRDIGIPTAEGRLLDQTIRKIWVSRPERFREQYLPQQKQQKTARELAQTIVERIGRV